MSEEITPALTASEWAAEEISIGNGYTAGLITDRQQGMFRMLFVGCPHRDGISATGVTGKRHALAALCLYDQPFGFTREDIALVRRAADRTQQPAAAGAWDVRHGGDTSELKKAEALALRSLASRIAALLPSDGA